VGTWRKSRLQFYNLLSNALNSRPKAASSTLHSLLPKKRCLSERGGCLEDHRFRDWNTAGTSKRKYLKGSIKTPQAAQMQNGSGIGLTLVQNIPNSIPVNHRK